MAFISLGALTDLRIEIPTKRTTGWADELIIKFFNPVVTHDHTAGGRGRQLGAGSLLDNSITSVKIQAAAVTAVKIAANAVVTAAILDLNITTAKIADSAVTTAKIANANVTAVKMAANSIATSNIIDVNVTTSKVADLAITTAKIAADAVNDTNIRLRNAQWLRSRNAANNADINIARVNASDVVELGASVTVADDTITTAKIADSAVTSDKILENAIIKEKIIASALFSFPNYINTTGTINVFSEKSPIASYELGPSVTASTIFQLGYQYARFYNRSGATRTIRVVNNGNGLGANITIANNVSILVYCAIFNGINVIYRMPDQAITNLTLA